MKSRWAWGAVVGAGVVAAMILEKRRRGAKLAADHRDQQVTEASDDSFPASDPPSHTPMGGTMVGTA